MMKFIHISLLATIIFFNSCKAQIDDPAIKLYDAIHYKININIDIQNKTLLGEIDYTLKPSLPIRTLVLSASNRTISVDSIKYQKEKLNFKHSNNHLYIDLYKEQTDTIFLKIFYRAISDFHGEFDNGGVYFDLSGSSPKIATSSQPFFTRKWLPSKDVPYDKATAEIKITVPDTLFAVSNGLLVETLNNRNGTKTFVWRTNYPISTYLISFAIGKYISFQENYTSISKITFPIHYYVFPEYLDKAKLDFNNTGKMLKFLEEYFGEYPFSKEKYGIVLVPGELIMENQTITSIQEDLITGNGDVEQILIHELAHHWFGNLVTPKSWHHLWLSEGFANYIQALYMEYYLGKKWYHYIINFYMDRELGAYNGSLVNKIDTSFQDIFSERIYFKGAIVLHMLRKVVGDSTFFRILKEYVTNPKFQYSNVTTEDFIETCESVSEKDLGWFFEQWVYASPDSIDRPVLKVKWNKINIDDGFKVSVDIHQLTSDIYNFTIPTELSIITNKDTLNFEILINTQYEHFDFFCKEEPLNIIIDKDNWVFKKIIR